MKLEIKYIRTVLFVLLWAFLSFSNQPLPLRQKIFLFLKEPLRDNSVTIRLKNGIEETAEVATEEKQVVDYIPNFEIFYSGGKQSKRTLSILLAQEGFIKLEVFDFYGKLSS